MCLALNRKVGGLTFCIVQDVAKNLAAAQKELLRLKATKKKASGDKEQASEVVDLIQEIIGTFKSIAPKLDQICVISNTVSRSID